MLTVLAGQWNILMFRGVLAILFGLAVFVWPGLTLTVLVILFGLYAFFDGMAALMMSAASHAEPGFGGLLFEALIGMAAGAVAFLYPDVTTMGLLIVIGIWAILTGVAAIVAAIRLRRELTGEWPLPLAGGLSVLLGVLLLLQPDAGALALGWMVASYAVLSGITLVALAIRMRQLAQEIAKA